MRPTDPAAPPDKHVKWQYRRALFTKGLTQYEATRTATPPRPLTSPPREVPGRPQHRQMSRPPRSWPSLTPERSDEEEAPISMHDDAPAPLLPTTSRRSARTPIRDKETLGT